jgi:hypothetical protein
MEKSKLENVSDKLLFYLLKGVSESGRDIYDRNYYDVCFSAAEMVGFNLEDSIDVNYIASTLKLNDNYDFNVFEPTNKLKRPIASIYKLDTTESRTEYVNRIYRNFITSYDMDLVIPTIESDDDWEYYDGEMILEDYYDAETTDVDNEVSSIKKIN